MAVPLSPVAPRQSLTRVNELVEEAFGLTRIIHRGAGWCQPRGQAPLDGLSPPPGVTPDGTWVSNKWIWGGRRSSVSHSWDGL